MVIDVNKVGVLEGFQKILGSIMVPALQKQEVSCIINCPVLQPKHS